MLEHTFKEGEYIIYRNGRECQIGRIKRLVEDGAFVWYHEGETASKTPFSCMYKLTNGYTIRQTSLGGAVEGAAPMFLANGQKDVELNLYDQEEIHDNCTVQILRNSYTGAVSVGWWDNETPPKGANHE